MNDKYIIYFISRTKGHMVKFIENRLKANKLEGLIPTHGNILTALYESNEKMTMKEISKKIGKDKSTVTSLVKKLEALGYVKRETSTSDKRNTYILLTEKARDVEPTFNSISLEVKETAYSNFTDDEKVEFLRLLRKLSTNFKKANE